MDLSSTPRARFRRRRFVSPTVSSPYRSPLIHSLPEKKPPSEDTESLDELKASVIELFEKNKALEEKIENLKNKGYKEDQFTPDTEKSRIDKLHRYNEIKDIAQTVMGKLAILDQVTIKEVHERYGLTDKD